MKTRVPRSSCPACGSENDAVAKISGRSAAQLPKPGSWCICAHCAAILRLRPDMQYRLATQADLSALPTGDLLQLAVARAAIEASLSGSRH
jgi:hypothetical protein